MKKKVLLTEEMADVGLSLLNGRDDVELVLAEDTQESTFIRLATDVSAIAVRMALVTGPVIAAAPKLEIVSRHGVGCDNIDVAAMTKRGLPVAIAAGANEKSVAESALMMMLATARRLREQDIAVRAGRYAERNPLSGDDCRSKHVLVIGFGRTGKATARVCKGIGMRVTVTDIALDAAAAAEIGCDTINDWRGILENVDIVTVHVPLTESTQYMIGSKELYAMPAGAIVINCARGGVVNEADLIDALDRGHVAAAGLDVYEQEPPPADYPLFARDDIILTPHTAGTSRDALANMSRLTFQNLLDHFDGKLNPEAVYNPEYMANN